MRIYTPGYFWAKLLSVIVFLAIAVYGFLDMWEPLRLLTTGRTVDGVIVKVEKTKSGFANEEYTTTEPIAEDRNRSATFWHYVEFITDDKRVVSAKINVASQLRPTYKVGDRITVSYDPRQPERVYASYDLKTWTMGSFTGGVGLCFALTAFFFTWYSRRPIELPKNIVPDKDMPEVPDDAAPAGLVTAEPAVAAAEAAASAASRTRQTS